MKAYDPNAALFSLHIPRTGGTSLRRSLDAWFPDGRLLFHYRPDHDTPPARHELRAGICVHGHFNAARDIGVLQYYPDASQFAAFLREPFDRFVSVWYKMNERKAAGQFVPQLDGCPDFRAWLYTRASEQEAGTNRHSMMTQLPSGTDFRQFVFVGITERFADSLAALARVLDRPPTPANHVNASPRAEVDLRSWKGFYERHFAVEFELYEAALAANSELLRQ